MTADAGSLRDLASAVADGSAVDWDLIPQGPSAAASGTLLAQLRLIADIASAHRAAEQPARPGALVESPKHAEPNLGRWGDLVLIEEVGQGSFATVYRALDPKLDMPVALK